MNQIAECVINGTEATVQIRTVDYIKVIVSGELAIQNADSRFLLRINELNTEYNSFVVMDGNDAGVEWETSGFYAGRNSHCQNASVIIEYTISALYQKTMLVGHGISTFAMNDNRLLGYTCNGLLRNHNAINAVSLICTNGAFDGVIKIYRYIN